METAWDSDIPSVDSGDGDADEVFSINEDADGLIFNNVYTDNNSVYTDQDSIENKSLEDEMQTAWTAQNEAKAENEQVQEEIWFSIPEEPQPFERAIAVIKTFSLRNWSAILK